MEDTGNLNNFHRGSSNHFVIKTGPAIHFTLVLAAGKILASNEKILSLKYGFLKYRLYSQSKFCDEM